MASQTKSKRYPLHIHIATLFIGLILVVGLILGWFNYQSNKAVILSASERLFDQVNRDVRLEFENTHGPTANTIELISLSPIMQVSNLEERITQIALFNAVLKDKPSISALSVGYANGDYFIVRSLYDEYMKERFSAPGDASISADHISSDTSGNRKFLRIFYNTALKEIERREMPDSPYDPRTRDWYKLAINSNRTTVGAPFLYYFIGKVGFSVGRKSADGNAVVAADITLESLSETLRQEQISPSAEVVIYGDRGNALAYLDPDQLVIKHPDDKFEIARLDQLNSPVISHVASRLNTRNDDFVFEFDNRNWRTTVRKIEAAENINLYLAIIAPEDELLSEAFRISKQATGITAVIVLLSLPFAWLFAHKITGSLRTLSKETDLIRQLDFSEPVQTRSMILEIDELAHGMDVMKDTINKFLRLISSLAGEQNFDAMLKLITGETLDVSKADGVGVYLLDDDEKMLQPFVWHTPEEGEHSLAMPDITIEDQRDNIFVQTIINRKVNMADIEDQGVNFIFSSIISDLHADGIHLVTIPLLNRAEEAIGVLYIVHRMHEDRDYEAFTRERIGFVKSLSGFAAVSLETKKLLKMQKALLEAFIKLIASAIDAKSPYTGGHCQRVPELTKMLARAACDSKEVPFNDYQLNDEDWEAIHIASWLHDCGKVTTPEYVVDKSTKLETIYDRIHEIRMRFEVIKRDAQIDYWQGIANGKNKDELKEKLDAELRALDGDFAFIAECNESGEFMAPERIERLEQIAQRTWMRTLDDTIGISWEEKQRKLRSGIQPLPVTENLLADKDEHIIQRDESDCIAEENPWGFRLNVPEYKYNRGELYNLAIGRGTLTDEERYMINDHIVQTIIMLEKLPYPKYLREVPSIAGGHHEKMDGTGYPKKLHKDDLSLTARMMAIADIFEALTASDRPYKKAKTLSEAIKIMGFMKKDQHIDPELFELFLRSGVYKEYAEKYLDPEQVDDVQLSDYLTTI